VISKPFDEIEKADIDAMIADGVAEGRTLDFKESLPGNGDGDKKEFLADVASFANASGGDLIFGVAESDGAAADAPGLAGINNDAETLRLDSSIRNGIEPRIPGVRIRAIDGFSNGPVLLIRIPRSWASPHTVTFKGTSRFYTRNNAGKHQMDVGEIRAAFDLSGSMPVRIREFRSERLGRIVAERAPVRLSVNPKIVVHLIPLTAFSVESGLDSETIYEHRGSFLPISGGSDLIRFNVDGVISISHMDRDGRGRAGYCQVFRSGIVESVDAYMIPTGRDRNLIPSSTFESEVVSSIQRYLDALKTLNVAPPVVVLVSLLGVDGFEMAVPLDWKKWEATPIDRDELLLPDVVIEEYSDRVAEQLRPILDAAWNSSGWKGSPHFDDDGKWTKG